MEGERVYGAGWGYTGMVEKGYNVCMIHQIKSSMSDIQTNTGLRIALETSVVHCFENMVNYSIEGIPDKRLLYMYFVR